MAVSVSIVWRAAGNTSFIRMVPPYAHAQLSGDPPHLRCHCNKTHPFSFTTFALQVWSAIFLFSSFSTSSTFFGFKLFSCQLLLSSPLNLQLVILLTKSARLLRLQPGAFPSAQPRPLPTSCRPLPNCSSISHLTLLLYRSWLSKLSKARTERILTVVEDLGILRYLSVWVAGNHNDTVTGARGDTRSELKG